MTLDPSGVLTLVPCASSSGESAAATTISIELVAELLLIATAVALGTKKLRIPYTVALTLVGIAVGFSHVVHPVLLSKEIVLLVFLPPLLFEGTLAMDLATLRAKWLEVLLLALPVTFLCVAIVAWPLHWMFGLDLTYCLLVGAILAPTDPVSVIALFREAGVTKKLAVTVEGESCFNDGVGVVVYLIFLRALGGESPSVADGVRLFGIEVLGGLAVGVLLGYATFRLLARIDDHLLEVMISLVLAYSAYLVSERLHVSGVMAVVAAGLIMGNYGKTLAMSPTTRLALGHFWEIMSFLANSLVFLLMGIAIESTNLLGAAARIGAAYGLLTAGRIALVHVTGLILGKLGRPMPLAWRHLIAWSGLRGSLCVALAIGLPEAFAGAGDGVPGRDETLTLVSGVVLASMLVQGLSMRKVIGWLGLSRREESEEAYEVELAREHAFAAAALELDRLQEKGGVPAQILAEMRASVEAARQRAGDRMTELLASHEEIRQTRRDMVVRAVLVAARSGVEEAFRRGEVSEHAHREVSREMDVCLEGGERPELPGAAREETAGERDEGIARFSEAAPPTGPAPGASGSTGAAGHAIPPAPH